MSGISFVEPLLYMLAAIAILFAAAYNIFSLRNGERMRRAELRTKKAELLWSIYRRWDDSDFLRAWNEVSAWQWKDYDDYMARYGPGSDPENEVKRGMIGIYFESVGVLLKRGLIDVFEVDDMMSGYIIAYWAKFSPVMAEFRKRNNRPEAGEHIEYLYREVKKVYDSQHKS